MLGSPIYGNGKDYSMHGAPLLMEAVKVRLWDLGLGCFAVQGFGVRFRGWSQSPENFQSSAQHKLPPE